MAQVSERIMTVEAAPIPKLEAWLAPVMFSVAFVYLLGIAGLLHRAYEPEVSDVELRLIAEALSLLWPLFVIEAIVSFLRRSPAITRRRALGRVFLVVTIPPARLGWVHPVTNRIWLPRFGWRPPGKPLLRLLEKVFGAPMLIFAFLILPVLALEYFKDDWVHSDPVLALALHLSISVIWVAFALEFILKISAAPSSFQYFKERWLDLAIVALPTFEFLLTHWVDAAPVARLFRLGRALNPQQIGAMSKAYRLRGLLMKGWYAFLLFEVVARITGNSPEKRLKRVEWQIAELEEQLRELRAVSLDLKKRMIPSPPVIISPSEPERP